MAYVYTVRFTSTWMESVEDGTFPGNETVVRSVPSLKTLVPLLCESHCFVENNLSKVCHILRFKIGRLESSMANKKSITLILFQPDTR